MTCRRMYLQIRKQQSHYYCLSSSVENSKQREASKSYLILTVISTYEGCRRDGESRLTVCRLELCDTLVSSPKSRAIFLRLLICCHRPLMGNDVWPIEQRQFHRVQWSSRSFTYCKSFLLGTTLSLAKTSELIEVPFVVLTRMGQETVS